ncbi:hypothetical protein, partial [Acetobacter pasteurianus]|uniref:hypothetical protein n=1 Tax=Acetobacter pasteurianus TaxID=438 RepID=UPI001BDD627D
ASRRTGQEADAASYEKNILSTRRFFKVHMRLLGKCRQMLNLWRNTDRCMDRSNGKRLFPEVITMARNDEATVMLVHGVNNKLRRT